MKQIQESRNETNWPRKKTPSIECRKRDLIVRIADWSKDKHEPAYDVEVYIGGVYDWNESKCCTVYEYKTLAAAKSAAIAFACAPAWKACNEARATAFATAAEKETQ